MSQVILALSAAITDKQPAVLATVVEVKGASPAKAGTQIVLLEDGTTAGTVGGGKLEAAILVDAKQVLTDGKPRLAHYTLTESGEDAVGILCGGEVSVFIHPFLPPPQLVIVGGGHIGRPLKVMGEATGFVVIVVDFSHRPDLARQYDVARTPALVLLDAAGEVVWKQDVG
jgi:xanthine dehydrogenase accessory factor